jgi:hypothetical protein
VGQRTFETRSLYLILAEKLFTLPAANEMLPLSALFAGKPPSGTSAAGKNPDFQTGPLPKSGRHFEVNLRMRCDPCRLVKPRKILALSATLQEYRTLGERSERS